MGRAVQLAVPAPYGGLRQGSVRAGRVGLRRELRRERGLSALGTCARVATWGESRCAAHAVPRSSGPGLATSPSTSARASTTSRLWRIIAWFPELGLTVEQAEQIWAVGAGAPLPPEDERGAVGGFLALLDLFSASAAPAARREVTRSVARLLARRAPPLDPPRRSRCFARSNSTLFLRFRGERCVLLRSVKRGPKQRTCSGISVALRRRERTAPRSPDSCSEPVLPPGRRGDGESARRPVRGARHRLRRDRRHRAATGPRRSASHGDAERCPGAANAVDQFRQDQALPARAQLRHLSRGQPHAVALGRPARARRLHDRPADRRRSRSGGVAPLRGTAPGDQRGRLPRDRHRARPADESPGRPGVAAAGRLLPEARRPHRGDRRSDA